MENLKDMMALFSMRRTSELWKYLPELFFSIQSPPKEPLVASFMKMFLHNGL